MARKGYPQDRSGAWYQYAARAGYVIPWDCDECGGDEAIRMDNKTVGVAVARCVDCGKPRGLRIKKEGG